jgi:hypothetical protein
MTNEKKVFIKIDTWMQENRLEDNFLFLSPSAGATGSTTMPSTLLSSMLAFLRSCKLQLWNLLTQSLISNAMVAWAVQAVYDWRRWY